MCRLAERLAAVTFGLSDETAVPLTAGMIRTWIEADAGPEPEPSVEVASTPASDESWRTRIWTAPEETRLNTSEVAEAVGRSRSWVYKRTGPGTASVTDGADRIPRRRVGTGLVFLAGEIREWIERRETEQAASFWAGAGY